MGGSIKSTSEGRVPNLLSFSNKIRSGQVCSDQKSIGLGREQATVPLVRMYCNYTTIVCEFAIPLAFKFHKLLNTNWKLRLLLENVLLSSVPLKTCRVCVGIHTHPSTSTPTQITV